MAGFVLMSPYAIRPLTERDIPKLADIRPGFVTDTVLRIETFGEGYLRGWRLVETKLDQPYNKGAYYDFDATERANITQRLAQNNTLLEVVAEQYTERVVGILDIEEQAWNDTATLWNVMLDYEIRRQGFGTELVKHAIDWAYQRGLRAIHLETQTNNLPACQFYLKMGFQLVGFHETFYSNRDLERDEVALFWSYPLV
jgi:ribosomal protein S18 acetylase RimI-like enzyme